MGEKESNISTEDIDLKTDIKEMLNMFPSIEAVYLFGSRAYKTNSTRSDIDLIIVSSNPIPSTDILTFRENHKYLDIFSGNKSAIQSPVTGSFISRKSTKSIYKQLDAVILWSKEKGFQSSDYHKQSVFVGQKFLDSAKPYPRDFISIKSKLNNPLLSDECKFYFQESLVDFDNECFLSCTCTFGLACECIIRDLVDKCIRKYSVDNPSDNWLNKYAGGQDRAKPLLEGLQKYFKENSRYFRENGFSELDNALNAFDVVRNYRNNADHPTKYQFNYDECCLLFSSMSIHIDKILKLVDFLNNNYP